MNRRIVFGSEALVIENDFKKVTSHIGDIQEPRTMFVFGDQLMQKRRVNSVIPELNEFNTPERIEVWSFRLQQ